MQSFQLRAISRFVRYHQMLATWQKTGMIVAGAKQIMKIEIGVLDALSVYDTSSMRQLLELGEYWLVLAQDSADARTPQHKLVHACIEHCLITTLSLMRQACDIQTIST